jgi:ABC-type (unclassified) transport system, ATPase component
MQENTLTIQNIRKKYARREVVSDVSFEVKSGEIVGLLGPNGAGKTTCFYIACGLVRADKGQVFIGNMKVSKLPMHKTRKTRFGLFTARAFYF